MPSRSEEDQKDNEQQKKQAFAAGQDNTLGSNLEHHDRRMAAEAGGNDSGNMAETKIKAPPKAQKTSRGEGTAKKPKAVAKGKAKAASKSAGKKRPAPAPSGGGSAAMAAGSYASMSAARGRGSFYVGRRKGFIDDSEVPEDETPEEKKRRLNRNNERRKRARRVNKIDFLNEQKDAVAEKNQKIKKDNQALRDQIALIRKHLQSGGPRTADLTKKLEEGAAAILPASGLAALDASTPAPAPSSPGARATASARPRSRPSPPSRTERTGAAASASASQGRQKAAPAPQARQRSSGSDQAAPGPSGSPPQQPPPQVQVPQLPGPSFTSPAAAASSLQHRELLDRLQRGGLGHASLGLPQPPIGLDARSSSLLERLRQDSALQRLGALGGGGGLPNQNPNELSARLRQELLLAQATAALHPGLSSFSSSNLLPASFGNLGGQFSSDPNRLSDNPLSPGSLRQRLLNLSSTTPAAGLSDADLINQLRGHLGGQQPHQPTSATMQLSALLSLSSAGRQQTQQQQAAANPFLLAALQQQQQQLSSATPSTPQQQGPRSLPGTNVAALPSQNLPLAANLLQVQGSRDNALTSMAHARGRATGYQHIADNLHHQSLAGGGEGGQNLSRQNPLSMAQRDASAYLPAADHQRQGAGGRRRDGGGSDTKGDDDYNENSQGQSGEDPYRACPQS